MSQTPFAHRLCARLAWLRPFLLAAFSALFLSITSPAHADLWSAAYFASEPSESHVIRYDEYSGAVLPNGIPFGSAGLSLPAGVAIGPDGNVYVSSQGTGEVLFYDGITGAPLTSPHEGGRDGLFATLPDEAPEDPEDNPGPSQLLFGPDGNLYVSDFNGSTVRKINGTSGVDEGAAMTGLLVPAGLAFTSDGDLLIGDMGAATVWRVHEGTPAPFIFPTGPPGPGDLQTPANLLVGPSDEIYVVDLFGNQILKYDQNGQNKELFAIPPPEIPDPLPEGVFFSSNNPSDIEIIDGKLVVSLLGLTYPPDNRGALLRYDMDGNLLEFITEVPGIYDGDHLVTEADYEKWIADYGLEVPAGTGADGNGDGRISAADYTVWRDHLGANAGLPPIGAFAYAPPSLGAGSSASIPVPEPSTLIVLVFGFVAALLGRRFHFDRLMPE